ncbi:MAG: hypothetical protein CM1200mP4_5480 [Rhodospirillaceae bacterium]|nr:MAG: hypothetical protein CM1200mP4_5480 [Rhodospirillaceae bacterium]
MSTVKKSSLSRIGCHGIPDGGSLGVKRVPSCGLQPFPKKKSEQWLGKHNGSSALTPKEAAIGCDIVFACVGNDDDVRSVVYGTDGALNGMQEGAIFVDHTTASANLAVELSEALKKKAFNSLMLQYQGDKRERKTVF